MRSRDEAGSGRRQQSGWRRGQEAEEAAGRRRRGGGGGGGVCEPGRRFAVRGAEARGRADAGDGGVREQAVEEDGARREAVGDDLHAPLGQRRVRQPAATLGGPRSRRLPSTPRAVSLAPPEIPLSVALPLHDVAAVFSTSSVLPISASGGPVEEAAHTLGKGRGTPLLVPPLHSLLRENEFQKQRQLKLATDHSIIIFHEVPTFLFFLSLYPFSVCFSGDWLLVVYYSGSIVWIL